MHDAKILQADYFLLAHENPLELSGTVIDGRKAIARRYRDKYANMVADLGGSVSVAEAMLVRRAAVLAMVCEEQELAYLDGKALDVDTFNRTINPLVKCLDRLGYKRNARNVTPDAKPGSAWAGLVLDAEGQAE